MAVYDRTYGGYAGPITPQARRFLILPRYSYQQVFASRLFLSFYVLCFTVPLVAALGLGLASTVPGRNPLLDGFGLIAFASLFPIMSVLAYAQLSEWQARRSKKSKSQ